MVFAPARRSRSMTSAWRLRLNGQTSSLGGSNVFGSIATTAIWPCEPSACRRERASSVWSSSESPTLVSNMRSPTAAPRIGASANVRRPGRLRTRLVAVAGQVAVALADRDGALADGVADAHLAAGDSHQGAVAAVGRAPHGAAHGRRRVAAARPEPPAPIAAPEGVRAALLRRRGAGLRAGQPAAQLERRHAAEATRLRLPHLEEAAPEPARLRRVARQRRDERDLAVAHVERGADRHLARAVQDVGAPGARE